MTTILYTPGTLTADSRRTNTINKSTDQTAKIRRFYDEDDSDTAKHMRFGDDIVTIGAGAGNVKTIDFLFGHLKVGGRTTIDVLNNTFQKMAGHVTGVHSCTILLVGQKRLYEINVEFGTIRGHRTPLLCLTEHNLSETFSCGTGGIVAETMFNLFGLPPALAVAAAGLHDEYSGDDVVHCYIGEFGTWQHRRVKHYDPDDTLAKMTDYFKKWKVSTHPFTLKKLPKMASNVVTMKPDRVLQDRMHQRELDRKAETARKQEAAEPKAAAVAPKSPVKPKGIVAKKTTKKVRGKRRG